MIPGLGEKYDIEIETISKPKTEYTTAEYLESGWPQAPAITVGDEIVVQGADISKENLESLISKHLGLPTLEPQHKGIFGRILKK